MTSGTYSAIAIVFLKYRKVVPEKKGEGTWLPKIVIPDIREIEIRRGLGLCLQRSSGMP